MTLSVHFDWILLFFRSVPCFETIEKVIAVISQRKSYSSNAVLSSNLQCRLKDERFDRFL